MDKVTKLREEKAAKLAAMKALSAKADAENRDLTKDEQTQYDALKAEYNGYDNRITRATEEAAEESKMSAAQPAQKGLKPGGNVDVVGDRDLKRPFQTLGDNLKAIADAAMPGGQIDKRLLEMKAALGATASVPSDGGFLIQHDFAEGIMKRAYETGVLASRCYQVEIGEGADGLEVPYVDETSRATGSRFGGVRVYWSAEAEEATATKPKIGKHETRLEELKGLAYATNRLLRDARAMSQLYFDAFSNEFAWTLDDAILNGDGAGKPLGILNSNALVSVTKETNQTASTILFKNVSKMRSRMYVPSRPKGVWFINQDTEDALGSMSLPVGTGGVPVLLPATGISGQPYDTLYGRPIIPVEQAKTLGTVGDIVFADLSQYLLIKKGGLEAASSMHVRFIYDEMTFRWTMAVNGQPMWKTSLTPANGSNTLSPFIALATRA